MYINNVLYCFYSSDTEALEACFRLLHDDDDDKWLYRKHETVSNGKLKQNVAIRPESGSSRVGITWWEAWAQLKLGITKS